MYKSVSFNIFDLHLEDIVYKDKKTQKSSSAKENISGKSFDKNGKPIPKPINEFLKDRSKPMK